MTITTWLMILAIAVGGTSQLSGIDSTTSSTRPPAIPDSNCWVNGQWRTPCPDDAPPPPPPPETQLPY